MHLEARLAAELYFSDDPGRARGPGRPRSTGPERLGDRRALGAAGAVAHDAFVVGQGDLDEQLRGSAQLLDWARETGSAAALLTAHRARVFDLLAAADLAAMDAEVLAFRRVAEPLRCAGLPVVAGAVVGDAGAARGPPRPRPRSGRSAAYQIGERPFPSLAFPNLSFLLFFLRREQGRLGEMEQATRDYAAVPRRHPGHPGRPDVPPRRDSAGPRRPAGMLGAVDDDALARLHDRNWPASWFQLARAAALVGDRDLARHAARRRHRPSERCVKVSLATVCLGATDLAAGLAAPHRSATSTPPSAHYRSAAADQRPHRRPDLARPDAGRPRRAAARPGPGR